MDKGKFKKNMYIALIIFIGLALAITYTFFLFRGNSVGSVVSVVVGVMRPIILGAVFAYIMKSTCNFYERKFTKLLLKSGKRTEKKIEKKVNFLSVLMTYITWVAIITLLLWIAIPQVVQSVTKFANDMVTNVPGYIENLTEWEKNFLKDHENLRPVFDKALNFIVEWTNTSLLPQLQSLAGTVMPMIVGFVTALIDIAIGLVISVFILAGRKTLAKKSKIFLHCLFKEKTVDLIVDEAKYADRMFSGFLEGKVIDSAIIGILYYIFLELMNVPYPALVAVICGVTNIIPIFGPFIGSVPSGLIILSADPIKVIPFIIFVCVIQFFDGYIIDPHIVGGNIQLSSFCVVFAVLVFGGLWGFVGLLVGVPTFAVIYDIVKKIVYSILKKKGKYDIIAKYKLTYSDDGPSKNKLVFLKKNKSNKEVKTSEVASEK